MQAINNNNIKSTCSIGCDVGVFKYLMVFAGRIY